MLTCATWNAASISRNNNAVLHESRWYMHSFGFHGDWAISMNVLRSCYMVTHSDSRPSNSHPHLINGLESFKVSLAICGAEDSMVGRPDIVLCMPIGLYIKWKRQLWLYPSLRSIVRFFKKRDYSSFWYRQPAQEVGLPTFLL